MNSSPPDSQSAGAAAASALADALQSVGVPQARLEELLDIRLSGQREPRGEPVEEPAADDLVTEMRAADPEQVQGAIASGEIRLVQLVVGRGPSAGGGLAPQL